MKELFDTLKQQITLQRLKELSLNIIEAHKNREETRLRLYGKMLFPQGTEEGKYLFYKLIKHFHPDRIQSIHKELEDAFSRGDRDTLLFYQKALTLKEKARDVYNRRFDMDYREMYDYGEEDFGYGDYADDDEHTEEREFDFISAVLSELMGNQDLTLTPANLASLEGELNLGGYGIEDTEGLQHCRNLSSLNLSDNRISNIYDIANLDFLQELYLDRNNVHDLSPLTGLTNLEVLDLAENEIEDISPLLTLDNLKFLKINHNPLRKAEDVLKLLQERGVIVIS